MTTRRIDWNGISQHPKFIELQRRKTLFLVSLWVVGATSYFLVLVGGMYAPGLFSTRVFGRLNFGYMFCLFQFALAWGIALLYTYKSNKEFDPLTKQLLDTLSKEETQ